MAENGDAIDSDDWRSRSAVSPLFPTEAEYSRERAITSPLTSPASPLPRVTVTTPTGEVFDGHDSKSLGDHFPDLSDIGVSDPGAKEPPTYSGRSLEEELAASELADTHDEYYTDDVESPVAYPTEDAGTSTIDADLFSTFDSVSDHVAEDDGHASDGGASAAGSHFSSTSSETTSDDASSVDSGADFHHRRLREAPPGAVHRSGRSPVGRVRNPPDSSSVSPAEEIALHKEKLKSRKQSPLRTTSITRDGMKITVVSPKSGTRVIEDASLAEEMDARENEGRYSISPVERYLAHLKASQIIVRPTDNDASIARIDKSIIVRPTDSDASIARIDKSIIVRPTDNDTSIARIDKSIIVRPTDNDASIARIDKSIIVRPTDNDTSITEIDKSIIVKADDSVLQKADEGVVGLGIDLVRPATPAPGDVRPGEDGDNTSKPQPTITFESPRAFSAESGQLVRAEKKDTLRLLRESKYPVIMAKIKEEEPPKPEADFDDKHVWWQFLRRQHGQMLELKDDRDSIQERLQVSYQDQQDLQRKVQKLENETDEAWDYVAKARERYTTVKEVSNELELEIKENKKKMSNQEKYIHSLEEELEDAEANDEKEKLEIGLEASQKLLQESQNRLIRLQAALDETRKPLFADMLETDEAGRFQAQLDRARNDLNNAYHVISQLKEQQTYTLGIASSIKEPWPRETRTQVADLIVKEVNRELAKDAEPLTRDNISEFLDWGYGIRKIFQEIRDTGYKLDERETLRSLLTSRLIYNNFDVFSAYVFANPPITEDEFLRRTELLQQSFDDISQRVMPIGKMEDILAHERKEKQKLIDANAEATEEIDNLKILLGDDEERRRKDRERVHMAEPAMYRLTVKENARLIKENEKLCAELEAEREGHNDDQHGKQSKDTGDDQPDDKQKSKDTPQEGEPTKDTGAKRDGDNEPEDTKPEEPIRDDASKHDSEEPEGICTIVRHAQLEGRIKDLEAQISNMPNLAVKVAELEAELEKAKSQSNDTPETEEQDNEISALSVFGPPNPDADGNVDDSGWKAFDACDKKGKILFLKESRHHWMALVAGHQKEHALLSYTEKAFFDSATQLRKNWYHEQEQTEYWQNEAQGLEQRLNEVRSSRQREISDLKRENEEKGCQIKRLESRVYRLLTRLDDFSDNAAEGTPASGDDQKTKRCDNCGRLLADVEECNRQYAILRSEARSDRRRCENNKQIAREAMDKYDTLKKSIDEKAARGSDTTALEADIAKLNKRITKHKKEIAALKAAAENKATDDKKAAEEREHAESLSSKPWLRPASARFLPASSEEQQAELKNLRKELAEAKATITRLEAGTTSEAETKTLQARLFMERSRCTQHEQRSKELEATNKTLLAQTIELQNGQPKKSSDPSDAAAKVQDLEKRNTELQRQLKSSREELGFINGMYATSKRHDTEVSAKLETLMRGGEPDPRFYDERLRTTPRKNAKRRQMILKNEGEEAAAAFDKQLENDDRRWHAEVRRVFGGDVPAKTEPKDPLELSKHKLAEERVAHGITTDRLKYVKAQMAQLRKNVGTASKTESSGSGDIHARCREVEKGLRERIAHLEDLGSEDFAVSEGLIAEAEATIAQDKEQIESLELEVEKQRIVAEHYRKEAKEASSAADKPKKPSSDLPAFIDPADLDKIDDPQRLRKLCAAIDAQRTTMADKLEVALVKNNRLEEQYFTAQAQAEKAQRDSNADVTKAAIDSQIYALQVQLDTAQDQATKLETELDSTQTRLAEAEAQLESQKRIIAAQAKPEKEEPMSASGLPPLITKDDLDKIENVSQLRQMCLAAEMFRSRSQTEHETAVRRNQQLQQRIYTLSSESTTRIHQLETGLRDAVTGLDAAETENERLTKDLRIIRSRDGGHSGGPTRITDLEAHLENARANAEAAQREAEAAQNALRAAPSHPEDSGRVAELEEQLVAERQEARRHAEWRREAIRANTEGKKHNQAMQNRLEQAKVHITDLEKTNTGLLERQNRWLGIVAGVEQRATERGEVTEELSRALENSKAVLGDGTTEEILAQLHKFFDDQFRVPWDELRGLRERQNAREAAGTKPRSKSTKARASAEELEQANVRANVAEKRIEDMLRDKTTSDARFETIQVLKEKFKTENSRLRAENESLRSASESRTSGSGSKDKGASSTEGTVGSTEKTSASRSMHRGRRPRSINLTTSYSSIAANILSPARYRNEMSPPRSKHTPVRSAVSMPPPPHPRWLPQTRAGAERSSFRPMKEEMKHQNDRDMNGAFTNALLYAETNRHNEWALAFMQQLQVNNFKTRSTEATRERAKDRGFDIPRVPGVDEEESRLEEDRRQQLQRLEAEIARQKEQRRQDEERRRRGTKDGKKKLEEKKDGKTKVEKGESSKTAGDGGQSEKGKTATGKQTKTGDQTGDQTKQTGDQTGDKTSDKTTKTGDQTTHTGDQTTQTGDQTTLTGDQTAQTDDQIGDQTGDQTTPTSADTDTTTEESDGNEGSDSGDSEDETLGWTSWPLGVLRPGRLRRRFFG